MNLIEEYLSTDNKLEFFKALSNQDKIDLYNKLPSNEKKQLLSDLSTEQIKQFIEIYSNKARIYDQLNKNQIIKIYKSSTSAEKQDIIKVLAEANINLLEEIDAARKEIRHSNDSILESTTKIEQSKNKIESKKVELTDKRQELKENKAIIKKLNTERKRALKQMIKAKNKTSPLKTSNKIAVISKYRIKKYQEKIEKYEQIAQNIDEQRIVNEQIIDEIINLKKDIKKENTEIRNEREKIQQEQEKINANVAKIAKTEAKIKKISNLEKKKLGKKLHNKVINKRESIMVRKKQEFRVKKSEPISSRKVEQVEVEVLPKIDNQHQNTTQDVYNIANNVTNLQEAGINFYPPVPINNLDPRLASNPITQMSQEQLVVILNTMLYFYNMMYQQQLQQQQNQEISNGYSRTLSPNRRGIVNLTLLTSIILFLITILLLISK